MLNAAQAEQNIALHFEHKVQSMAIPRREVTLCNLRSKKTFTKRFAFLLGCDGAYSIIRRELIKTTPIDFSQTYIRHAYKEFCIPSTTTSSGQKTWKLATNYLHIWPREEFMLIALPNLDGSFTATLFYPLEDFEKIKYDAQVIDLFQKYFPDALRAIGEGKLCQDFWHNPTGTLVTIRCSRYHYQDRVLLLGDAAHAMVPFYGQGMNAGFEDLLVLNQLLQKPNTFTIADVFSEYSRIRRPDAHAICDLALYNHWEMSTAVNSRLFRIKRYLVGLLHKMMPRLLVPLYSMVAFSIMPYAQVVRRHNRQERMINMIVGGLGLAAMGALSCLGVKVYRGLFAH